MENRVAYKKKVYLIQIFFDFRYVTKKSSPDIQSELTMGNNLNDNKRHRVTIIRKGRLNKLQLDNNTKILLSPPPFLNLSVNSDLYVGGVGKIYRSSLPSIVVHTPMYKGKVFMLRDFKEFLPVA